MLGCCTETIFNIFQVAYDSGIPRRVSYLFIAALFVVMVSCSTLFFLPKRHMDESLIVDIKRRRSSVRRKPNVVVKDDETNKYLMDKVNTADAANHDEELEKQIEPKGSLLNGTSINRC